MQLRLITEDRLGITHEVLALIAQHQLDLATMEMGLHNIYLNVPQLQPAMRSRMEAALLAIPGVKRIETVSLMPGEVRRQQLDLLLASMAQPVFVLNRAGQIVVHSEAAARLSGAGRSRWVGLALGELLKAPKLWQDILDLECKASNQEVSFGGRAWILDAHPLKNADTGALNGAVVTLRAPEWLGDQAAQLQRTEPPQGLAALLGESAAMRSLRARAERVALVEAPLMILGETGTGKELVARACHQRSRRQGSAFLALNAAALPESLAESELFGYASGAFSGAQRGGKPGLFEMANGGTVFLDEIGEMSLYLQAKLLRFLNDGSFRRVGGEREQVADVRIICATHRNLEQMVERGQFREDLYYRLNVLTLTLAPLRERGEDVLLLCDHFLARSARQIGRDMPQLSPEARQALLRHRWPGNVRQLQNLIFRAVTMTERDLIEVADLDLPPAYKREPGPMEAGASRSSLDLRGGGSEDDQADLLPSGQPCWAEAVEQFERELLLRLYPDYPSSRKLAQRLGLSHNVVATKLKRHGIGRST